jgi:hypothetical protein
MIDLREANIKIYKFLTSVVSVRLRPSYRLEKSRKHTNRVGAQSGSGHSGAAIEN